MKLLTTLSLVLLFTASLTAQEFYPESVENKIDMTQSFAKGAAIVGAFGEVVKLEPAESAISVNKYKRPTYFSDNFTGYTIQLTTSMERLADNNSLFAEFGDLMVEENTNPRYCYMMGDFVTKDGAEKFLKTVILQRYPEAKVIRYKKGKRKRLK